METPENPRSQSPIYALLTELAKTYEGTPTQEECRTVNSECLFKLIQEHKIPGIIYTLQPLEKVLYDYWSFHSVGVLQSESGKYIVYDITNPQHRDEKLSPDNFFYTEGSLEEISSVVSNRFGGDWDMEFQIDAPTSRRDPNDICVANKIDDVRARIANGQLSNPTHALVSPDSGKPAQTAMATLDANVKCPLGIKYQYNAGLQDRTNPVFSRIRAQFTYGYA